VRRRRVQDINVGELRLTAPVGRVAALDTWIGYHPQLEYEILPQVEDLVREAERLLFY
jgi:2-oxoisovalerate dehydrogenase E1 component